MAVVDMEIEKEFTVAGVCYRTTSRQFVERLSGVSPDRVRAYWVEIGGQRYPINQAVAVGLGALRADVQTHHAVGILRSLGFEPRGRESA